MIDTENMSQAEKDSKIRDLHQEASAMWPKIERIIDDLKVLGPHSLDGENALMNIRNWLDQISKR